MPEHVAGDLDGFVFEQAPSLTFLETGGLDEHHHFAGQRRRRKSNHDRWFNRHFYTIWRYEHRDDWLCDRQ